MNLALLLLFVTGISARGLRVAWEKMFLFLAYRIDQMEPNSALRTIGFKCETMLLDHTGTGYCQDNRWTPCEVQEFDPSTRTRVSRNCIGFKEFIAFIDDRR
jgi:hypothetical protein